MSTNLGQFKEDLLRLLKSEDFAEAVKDENFLALAYEALIGGLGKNVPPPLPPIGLSIPAGGIPEVDPNELVNKGLGVEFSDEVSRLAKMDMPSVPPGSGKPGVFPQSYPYRTGEEKKKPYAYGGFAAPLPSALLRPLKQPLYDTIRVPEGYDLRELRFMMNGLGQRCPISQKDKDSNDTNLIQPGQLANPLEFSVFGFNLTINGLDEAEKKELLYNSNFTFLYTGNRIYLNLPAEAIPETKEAMPLYPILQSQFGAKGVGLTESQKAEHGVSEKDSPDEAIAKSRERVDKMIKDAKALRPEFYSFIVGSACLRIRPTESFQIRLEAPKGLKFKKPFSIRPYIIGLQWTPL